MRRSGSCFVPHAATVGAGAGGPRDLFHDNFQPHPFSFSLSPSLSPLSSSSSSSPSSTDRLRAPPERQPPRLDFTASFRVRLERGENGEGIKRGQKKERKEGRRAKNLVSKRRFAFSSRNPNQKSGTRCPSKSAPRATPSRASACRSALVRKF